MKINSKNLGLVTKKFNDFFLVDLKNQETYLIARNFYVRLGSL